MMTCFMFTYIYLMYEISEERFVTRTNISRHIDWKPSIYETNTKKIEILLCFQIHRRFLVKTKLQKHVKRNLQRLSELPSRNGSRKFAWTDLFSFKDSDAYREFIDEFLIECQSKTIVRPITSSRHFCTMDHRSEHWQREVSCYNQYWRISSEWSMPILAFYIDDHLIIWLD